jgi:endonuclease III
MQKLQTGLKEKIASWPDSNNCMQALKQNLHFGQEEFIARSPACKNCILETGSCS